MGNCRTSPTNNTIGFCLLPSELIERILLCLALPEIIRFKLVSKTVASIISHQDFVRQYNLRLSSTTWLFLFKKRCHRYSLLDGFAERSDRWFRIPISNLLKPFIFPGEDLFFLTAGGNIFLFASNSHQAVITVNLVTNTVRKIPPTPLGPRGTCSWRRSGMKLLPGPIGSEYFRFLFAELVENRPVVFEYDSETDKWQSMVAKEDDAGSLRVSERVGDHIFLSVMHGANESSVIAIKSPNNTPVILRPRFDGRTGEDRQLTVGFSWGKSIDRLHVCGDGYMMIAKSDGVDGANTRVRMLKDIEMWGLGLNGRNWEMISKLHGKLMEQIKKPYGVMMGCLEGINGTINAVLMSNLEGLWDIIWLQYDIVGRQWTWVPLPDCRMKGLNMAGIAVSSGLTLP
ncbi:hypothetical protein FEM48_Zijuj12G0027700 [Ziziphus jujuba var. spinosa]|uniref:F-box domain-containing protein n=1 Tax=Ziziphus jujuba var. spinosa TaxID=714518 RepID=A0A978UAR9_ZIZJJ|nr:hypothetical protein FEM48_Zijuj12G0027700 [Ziziphus jujuba var. spinosa]